MAMPLSPTIYISIDSSLNVIIGPNLSSHYQHVVIYFRSKSLSSLQFSSVSLQLHTQSETVVASFSNRYIYGKSSISSDASVFYLLTSQVSLLDGFIGSDSSVASPSLLVAVGNKGPAPIPGGCCLTCAMEIDPNINPDPNINVLPYRYDNGRITLFFHRASTYYHPEKGSPSCDDSSTPSTYTLKYTVYYRYVDDMSSRSLFDAIRKMSSSEKIKKYGTKLSEISGRARLRLTLQSIRGQGLVFNVIVYDPNVGLSSAYTPIARYNCHFTGPYADCYVKKDVTSLSYCVICATVGILMCVAGLRVLQVVLFVAGWLLYWLVLYIALYQRLFYHHHHDQRHDVTEWDVMIMSSIAALCGGGLTTFLHAFRRTVIVSHLTLCLVVGMFLTSVIFYTPVGHLSFWDGEEKFMFAFCCISIVFGTFFFFLPKFLAIFSSSMLGSYAVVQIPNYLLGGSLQYIVLITPLRMRGTVDFFLERPYHLVDYVLAGVWALLWIVGIVIQYCTSRNLHLDLSDLNPFRGGEGVSGDTPTTRDLNERTPLIEQADNYNPSGSFRYNNSGHLYSFGHPNVGSTAPAPSAPDLQPPVEAPPPYSPIATNGESSVQFS